MDNTLKEVSSESTIITNELNSNNQNENVNDLRLQVDVNLPTTNSKNSLPISSNSQSSSSTGGSSSSRLSMTPNNQNSPNNTSNNSNNEVKFLLNQSFNSTSSSLNSNPDESINDLILRRSQTKLNENDVLTTANNNGNINKSTDQTELTPMTSINEKQNLNGSSSINKNLELNESNNNNEKQASSASSSNSNSRPSSGLFAIATGNETKNEPIGLNELNQSPSKHLLKLKTNDQQQTISLIHSTSNEQDIQFSSAPSSPVISNENLTNVLESSIDDDAKMIATKKNATTTTTATTPQTNKKNSISTNLTPMPTSSNNLNGVVGSQGKDLNVKEKHKKPWYSAFINTYKQKNEDFKKLFKLPPDEHLLVDYSCALQREILAHGRLYISLNYLCFRANIIGWETTLIIRLKDIKTIYKDKTAKIIPNAISIVLEHEKYFLTSFVSRDKTYNTLFRVWQIALADASMSQEEFSNILKSYYGEDLGYNSDDADYEYYSKLKTKASSNALTDLMPAQNSFYTNPQPLSTSVLLNKRPTNLKDKPNATEAIFDSYNLASPVPIQKKNHKKMHSSDATPNSDVDHSKSARSTPKNSKNNNDSINVTNHPVLGHRQSSSYDTSLIDTSEQIDNERPRSMVATQGNLIAPLLNQQTSSHSKSKNKLKIPKSSNIDINQNNTTNNLNANNQSCSCMDTLGGGQNSSNEGNDNDLNINNNNNYEYSDNNNDEVDNHLNNNSPSTNELQKPAVQSNNGFSTSSPVDSRQSSASSSAESDQNDDQNESFDNAKCNCDQHVGKEMLNMVFNLSVNYLWESLFGHTTFCQKYWESRKFGNLKMGEWKAVDALPARRLEYTVDLGGIGRPKNTEDQKILEYRPDQCIVLESESATHGVPYADYFTVRNRFCMTRVTHNTTRLVVTSFLNYTQKPNFIAKSFIERNAMGALKDSYNYLASYINNEFINIEKFCHENISQACIAALISSNLVIDNNNKNNNSEITSTMVETIATSTTASMTASGIGAVTSESLIIYSHPISSVNTNQLKEKNLPNNREPSTKLRQISAFSSLQDSSKFNKLTEDRSSSNKGSKSKLEGQNQSNENDKSLSNSDANMDDDVRLGEVINNKKSISRSTTYGASKRSKTDSLKRSENDSNLDGIQSNQQFNNAQLVRIQKFSFFKWEINVDTLVRLFIVAMIFLMVINGMLYYKLRRIETLADNLRSDPNLMLKMQEYNSRPPSNINKDSYSKEIYNWRDLITNTLTAIEKMENSLRDWDKSLETRQKEKPKLVVKDDEVNNDYANINTNSNNINNNNNNNGEL